MDLLLVCMGVVLYFDYWVLNFGIQEYMLYSELMELVFSVSYKFDDGYFILGEMLGYGVDIDEEFVKKYLYKCVCLLVNWFEDGIFWYW